jgi:hypothetical protein
MGKLGQTLWANLSTLVTLAVHLNLIHPFIFINRPFNTLFTELHLEATSTASNGLQQWLSTTRILTVGSSPLVQVVMRPHGLATLTRWLIIILRPRHCPPQPHLPCLSILKWCQTITMPGCWLTHLRIGNESFSPSLGRKVTL